MSPRTRPIIGIQRSLSESRPSQPCLLDDAVCRGGGEEGLMAVEQAAPAGAHGTEGAEVRMRALDHPAPGTRPRCFGRPVLRGLRGMSAAKPKAATAARKAVSSKAPSAANTP